MAADGGTMAFPSLLLSIQLLTRTELDAASSENQVPFPVRFAVGDYLLRIGFSSSSKLTPSTLGDRLSSEKAMVRSIAFLLTFVALAFAARADEGHHHDDLSEQQFGSVHFPTSCNPKVQKN